ALAAYVAEEAPLAVPPDEAAIAAYRPAELAHGGEKVPPQAHLMAPLPGNCAAPDEVALAAAATTSVGAFDSIGTIVDLLSLETAPETFGALLDELVGRFALALTVRNVDMSATALGALHAERMLRTPTPALAAMVEAAIERCGEPASMQAYAALLAELLSGSPEHARAADLLQ